MILEAIGSNADELRKKATALLEILDLGLTRYQKNLSMNSIESQKIV
jgi:hypothetical protein